MMRGPIPVAVAFIAGMFMVISFFSANPEVERVSGDFLTWVSIVSGFTILLGVVSIARANWTRVRRRQDGWPYGIVLLVFLVLLISPVVQTYISSNFSSAPSESAANDDKAPVVVVDSEVKEVAAAAALVVDNYKI